MKEFLDELRKIAGWKYSKDEAHALGVCLKCGMKAEDRIYSEAGKKEYKISGLCEICWDEITKDEGD